MNLHHPIWNPRHPVWGIALLAVFSAVRLGFANSVDGDELRDVLLVAGIAARDFFGRKSEGGSGS